MSTRITTRGRIAATGALALAMALSAACGGGTSGGTSSAPSTNGSSAPKPAESSKYPGTADGAKTLLAEFVKPGADLPALSKQLEPSKADYEAVFEPSLSSKAETMYEPAWSSGQMVVQPKAGQTEVKLISATTDELKSWSGKATDFPGGYKDVASHLKPGLTLYKFSFVEPGQDLGMAFDGLVYVNGNWRLFPKPYRLVA